MAMLKLTAGMFFAVAVAGLVLAADAPVAGGYKAVDVADKNVVAAAEIAIAAHSKKEKVALVKIVKAESQVVAGTNYKLTLDVKVEGGTRQAEAVVWRKLDKTDELTQWKWTSEVRKADK